jgi:hypothetical protein
MPTGRSDPERPRNYRNWVSNYTINRVVQDVRANGRILTLTPPKKPLDRVAEEKGQVLQSYIQILGIQVIKEGLSLTLKSSFL